VALVGVLSDTHVPDLQAALPARALEVLADGPVDMILHAGDISSPRLLRTLTGIAPVFAVRGNRDLLWPANWSLPARRVVDVGRVRVGLVHGHGPLLPYAVRRLRSLLAGSAPVSPVDPINLKAFAPDVRVVVYGHDHIPSISWHDSTLFLNPGTASPGFVTGAGPTLGLLRVEEDDVSAEIVSLA
jgi:putative phosphoesterase